MPKRTKNREYGIQTVILFYDEGKNALHEWSYKEGVVTTELISG
ncbi:hypothetical protein VC0101557_09950 [Vibrio cholerae VC0101557]|uniref:Uncharacterized protein n=2 Tax=Vibrio cholerae TaxID=666 RepID=A0A655YPI3_VIBCL|nr:hypothetical protein ASZ80_03426 [Vibrio cholerae]EAZ72525.1 hypothetical protein A5C_A0715 [Vibrio cholerae NCTC 8457]EAZ75547.1 hypothetical protein A5E_A0538 [Vibrio cholerae B33]EET23814.1 conserved hypothetical protein [Vibrio cholerae MO10]EET91840.1 hypothetical protein VCH_003081 [Vibrio cholerae CIRS101]EEY41034.1 hypothetical protein VIJ_002255 [Vibrio cholerae RC27]EEY49608.1 hypothetical protein VIG_000410 [Vibrio cholerae INDRE 91/1]EGR01330.1 hypothetical protein VCHCUF01_24